MSGSSSERRLVAKKQMKKVQSSIKQRVPSSAYLSNRIRVDLSDINDMEDLSSNK